MGRRFFVQIKFATSNFETALDDERVVGILHFLWCRFRPSLGMLSIVIFRNLFYLLLFISIFPTKCIECQQCTDNYS